MAEPELTFSPVPNYTRSPATKTKCWRLGAGQIAIRELFIRFQGYGLSICDQSHPKFSGAQVQPKCRSTSCMNAAGDTSSRSGFLGSHFSAATSTTERKA